MPDLGVILKLLFMVVVVMAALLPVITWVERKQSAVMQDRIGANRADILGIRLLGLLFLLLVGREIGHGPDEDVVASHGEEEVTSRGEEMAL